MRFDQFSSLSHAVLLITGVHVPCSSVVRPFFAAGSPFKYVVFHAAYMVKATRIDPEKYFPDDVGISKRRMNVVAIQCWVSSEKRGVTIQNFSSGYIDAVKNDVCCIVARLSRDGHMGTI